MMRCVACVVVLWDRAEVHVWILQLHQRCSLALNWPAVWLVVESHHRYRQPVAWILALSCAHTISWALVESACSTCFEHDHHYHTMFVSSFLLVPQVDSDTYVEPQCSCGEAFCFRCTKKPHSPCTCEQMGCMCMHRLLVLTLSVRLAK